MFDEDKPLRRLLMATLPEFALTKAKRKRDERGVICLGEQIAIVEWGWNMNLGWRVKYAFRPVNALMTFVGCADRPRDVATFSDETLMDGIREMLADGRLPYGEALARVRIEIIEAGNRRAAAAAVAAQRERQEEAGPDLYAALKSIMATMPRPTDRGSLTLEQWEAARAALVKAEVR